MCHASLDPKFACRDIEAQLSTASVRTAPGESARPAARGGLAAWVRRVLSVIPRVRLVAEVGRP